MSDPTTRRDQVHPDPAGRQAQVDREQRPAAVPAEAGAASPAAAPTVAVPTVAPPAPTVAAPAPTRSAPTGSAGSRTGAPGTASAPATAGAPDSAGRWTQLQSQFVDDPEAAVRSAVDLVQEAVQQVLQRHHDSKDTEELRTAFLRCRDLHRTIAGPGR